ncbi:MAG: YcxB family protein [Bacteroides sp.]
MDIIRFNTTLKASGKEYARIVYWNRFWRNKTELILTCLPAAASIVLFCLGLRSSFMLIIYVILCAYPFFIFSQCKSSIKYHLKNRDASESAPCEITLMPSGILAEIKDYNLQYTYNWNDFTTIYDTLGYYMMFNKGTMIVMIRKADIPDTQQTAFVDYVFEHVDQNKCLIKIK